MSSTSEIIATHDLRDDPPHGLSWVSRRTCSRCGKSALQAPGGPLYGSATTDPCEGKRKETDER